MKWNGELLEYNNQEGGFIMKLIDQNLTSFYLEDPRILIQILVYLLQDLVRHIDS